MVEVAFHRRVSAQVRGKLFPRKLVMNHFPPCFQKQVFPKNGRIPRTLLHWMMFARRGLRPPAIGVAYLLRTRRARHSVSYRRQTLGAIAG